MFNSSYFKRQQKDKRQFRDDFDLKWLKFENILVLSKISLSGKLTYIAQLMGVGHRACGGASRFYQGAGIADKTW